MVMYNKKQTLLILTSLIKHINNINTNNMNTKKQIVGENTIWDGPLSQTGRPHGKGSSSGITGMKLKMDQPIRRAGPITRTAKK